MAWFLLVVSLRCRWIDGLALILEGIKERGARFVAELPDFVEA